MAELIGAETLREHVLDRALADEASARGVSITDDDIDRERQRLAQALDTDAGTAFADVAARRRLGPERLPALLKRNALLRALADADPPTEAELTQARRARFGAAARARIVITATERDAAAARAAADADPAGPSAGLAAQAFRVSLDPSAAIGGLIERASLSDPRWPAAVIRAFESLPNGELSPVLGVPSGWALVLVEQRFPPTEPTPSELETLRSELAAAQERAAMAEVARRLVARAEVTVLSPHLTWPPASP